MQVICVMEGLPLFAVLCSVLASSHEWCTRLKIWDSLQMVYWILVRHGSEILYFFFIFISLYLRATFCQAPGLTILSLMSIPWLHRTSGIILTSQARLVQHIYWQCINVSGDKFVDCLYLMNWTMHITLVGSLWDWTSHRFIRCWSIP